MHSFTSFDGHKRIVTGPLPAVAVAVKRAIAGGAAGPVLIFDNVTGRSIDIDTRGADEEIIERLGSPAPPSPDAVRGRGRPKLGVVAREVTLLPRHWEWLAAQPGGASVVLRKLVDEARRAHGDRDMARKTQERAYHFMSAMAGDLPGFEEATRALFANDVPRFTDLIAAWPSDIRDHTAWLASNQID